MVQPTYFHCATWNMDQPSWQMKKYISYTCQKGTLWQIYVFSIILFQEFLSLTWYIYHYILAPPSGPYVCIQIDPFFRRSHTGSNYLAILQCDVTLDLYKLCDFPFNGLYFQHLCTVCVDSFGGLLEMWCNMNHF